VNDADHGIVASAVGDGGTSISARSIRRAGSMPPPRPIRMTAAPSPIRRGRL